MSKAESLNLADIEKTVYHLPFAVCIFCFENDDFKVLVNDAACNFFNATKKELISYCKGETSEVVHPEDHAFLYKLKKLIYNKVSKEFVGSFRMKSKESHVYRTICYSGFIQYESDNKTYVYIHYFDKPIEYEVRIKRGNKLSVEVLLEKILSTTQAAIFWKDADRRFLGANKAFLDYYGFQSVDEIIGKNDEDMGWHNDPDPFKNDELQVIEKGVSTYRVHGKCISHGRECDIVASKAPMYENGKIIGLVGSFEDVTSDYEQQRKINELNQKLEISLKNEEHANQVKSDFIARMSHDMRTPLTTIIGLSDIALDENYGEEINSHFHHIKDSSQYLLELINEILDMQRIENGRIIANPEPIRLSDVESIVESIIQPMAESKNLDLKIKQINEEINDVIYTDGHLLEQVLINVLGNAVKYTIAGGMIFWEKEHKKLENGQIVASYNIKDTGVGISKDFQKRMYEPFSREENAKTRSENGTGLGLAITKSTVDFMKGTISCKSELDKGTTFTIVIPFDLANEEQKQEYVERHDTSDYVKMNGKHILICEDVLINAEIVKTILGKYGVVCDIAGNGEEGLDKAKSNKYDAILMDIHMPIMDGYTATENIRKFDTDVPIIALSANAYKPDIQKSLDSGMNAHVMKPVKPDDLYQTLCKFII